MFRKLAKNKKAQNTAEYAILISLVVAGIIAMQTYAQRALNARVRGAAIYLTNQTSQLGSTLQYEPYYLNSDYGVIRQNFDAQYLSNTLTRQEMTSNTIKKNGYTSTSFNKTNDTDGD